MKQIQVTLGSAFTLLGESPNPGKIALTAVVRYKGTTGDEMESVLNVDLPGEVTEELLRMSSRKALHQCLDGVLDDILQG